VAARVGWLGLQTRLLACLHSGARNLPGTLPAEPGRPGESRSPGLTTRSKSSAGSSSYNTVQRLRLVLAPHGRCPRGCGEAAAEEGRRTTPQEVRQVQPGRSSARFAASLPCSSPVDWPTSMRYPSGSRM
jgi:hypothetical protein